MKTDDAFKILFVAPGDPSSAYFATGVTNDIYAWRFDASAAVIDAQVAPSPRVHALLGYVPTDPIEVLPIGWYANRHAPAMDFIFWLDDRSAVPDLPWPGTPRIAHWHIPPLAALDAPEDAQADAARQQCWIIRQRLSLFAALPNDALVRANALPARMEPQRF